MPLRTVFILVAVLVMAAALGAAWLTLPSGVELRSGTVLDTPRPISDFELVDHHHQPFTRAQLEGGWSLIFIGFTHCPDVCPMTLAMLGEIDTRLRSDGHDLQSVFVSVDPERDTPEVLARYVGYFSDEIIGATGAEVQLDRFCDELGFAYIHVPGSGGEYSVDHSGALALIDDRARLVGYFLPPFELEDLVADLAQLVH